MLLFLPVDHIYDGAFLSSIRVSHGVERELFFFKEGDLPLQGHTEQGKISVNTEISHDLFSQSEDGVVPGQHDSLFLAVDVDSDTDAALEGQIGFYHFAFNHFEEEIDSPQADLGVRLKSFYHLQQAHLPGASLYINQSVIFGSQKDSDYLFDDFVDEI